MVEERVGRRFKTEPRVPKRTRLKIEDRVYGSGVRDGPRPVRSQISLRLPVYSFLVRNGVFPPSDTYYE